MAARMRRPRQVLTQLRRPYRDIPELMSAGVSDAPYAIVCDLHAHDYWEIHYVARGMFCVWVEDSFVQVRGGELLVVVPGEQHGGKYGIVPPGRFYWLGVTLDGIASSFGAPASAALARALAKHARRPVRAGPELGAQFELLVAPAPRVLDPLFTVRARAAILGVLLRTADPAAVVVPAPRGAMVEAATRLMDENLASPLEIPALARRLGWATSHLQHAFRAEVGMPPSDYYLWLRIGEACRRLEHEDTSVTRIGLDLGFASSAYFATAYKRVMGITPQAYRRAVKRGRDPKVLLGID